jgi:hypothetical protein
MKLSIKISILLSFSLTAICCLQSNSKWTGGAIVEEGIYETSNIQIRVEVDNDLVYFKALDHAGKTILQNPHAFSALHRWVLYLDRDESFGF